LGRATRWTIAAIVTSACFGLTWWVTERIRIRSDISLTLASLASAIALAIVAWWASQDDHHRTARADGEAGPLLDHSPYSQTVGSVSGGVIINSFGAIDFHGASPSAGTEHSPDAGPTDELSSENTANRSSPDPNSSPLLRYSVTVYQAEGITLSENLEIYESEAADKWLSKYKPIQQSPRSNDE
jgi:hypothetical protein